MVSKSCHIIVFLIPNHHFFSFVVLLFFLCTHAIEAVNKKKRFLHYFRKNTITNLTQTHRLG